MEIWLWVLNGAAALTGAAYSHTYLGLDDPFFVGVLIMSILMSVGLFFHFRGFKKLSPLASGVLSVLSALYFLVEPKALFVELAVILVISALLTVIGLYSLWQKGGEAQGA